MKSPFENKGYRNAVAEKYTSEAIKKRFRVLESTDIGLLIGQAINKIGYTDYSILYNIEYSDEQGTQIASLLGDMSMHTNDKEILVVKAKELADFLKKI
ncbi:hypothetical protein H6784_05020 [Candidatus Nomurabacteria bacterium]|nr:hypothetical protein [Candidatus Nomurabacteria bacterium]